MKIKATILILIFIISGCSLKNPVIKASNLSENGLLVGRIAGNNPDNFFMNGNLTIDGKEYSREYNDALKNGYIMLSLKPGKYTIQDIRKTNIERTSSHNTTTTTKLITLNTTFTIQPSQITNIGIIMVLSNKSGQGKFDVSLINNNPDMEAYLGRNHPKIYNSLSKLELLTTNGNYLNKKEIRKLRKILLHRLPPSQLSGSYAGTILGTMAKISRNENGELQKFSLFNTQTFEDIKVCAIKNKRIACIISSFSHGDRLMMTTEKGLAWRSLPKYQENRFYIKLIGDKKIVLVTDRLKVFSSIDYAKTWSVYTGAQLVKPIEKEYTVGFSEGDKGYYIYSKDIDNTLIYNTFEGNNYVKLNTPENGNPRSGLEETHEGLYSGPEYTDFAKGKVFFKAKGQDSWNERNIPSTKCTEMSLVSRSNDQVAINCESADKPDKTNTFISSDTGKNWVIKSDS